MEVSTFEEDLLGLEEFANRLDKFIATELDFVEGSLVLALSAKFGYGKTTFLKMWSSSLKEADKKEDKEAEEEGDKPFVISLNAWESDYCGDPLFAIISALVDCIQEEGKSAQKIINAAKDVGWAMAAIGGQVLKKKSGIDVAAVVKSLLRKRAKREDKLQIQTDTFSVYQGREKAMKSLKKALQDFVKGNKPRKILFLVDELDRCRPDYAISYLETIKHIFDINGAVFVLAADRQQLENSAKKAFGSKLDFEEYYRKFVHKEVPLPEITKGSYAKLASKYVNYYLEREGSRMCFMKLDDNYRVENISELVAALKLTPRQIQEAFRILGHLLATTEEKRGRLLWCFAAGSILMAALKIGESKVYDRLGNQGFEPQEAYELLKNLLGEDNVEWWFTLILTGIGLKDEEVNIIMKKFGFSEVGEINQWRNGWNQNFSNTNRFVEIVEKIEQISQWD